MTLNDLVLGPDEAEALKHLSKMQRKAILDMFDIYRFICDEKEMRLAAMELKRKFRKATLGEGNELDSDKAMLGNVEEKTLSYFHANT
jgi:hypothetical protein